jgi:nucleoside-diphosphate-sugar epimerase
MRVLITGAQGWLGRYTCAAFAAKHGSAILGIGRSPPLASFTHVLPGFGNAPMPSGLLPMGGIYQYEQCDIADGPQLEEVAYTFRPSVVVHLAGAIPGASHQDLRANETATRSLMRVLSRVNGLDTVILGSSGSVYGQPILLPQDEDHPVQPTTDYARSKLASEIVAREEMKGTKTRLIIARIFNLVGPGCPVSLLPGSIAFQLARSVAQRSRAPVTTGPLTTVRDYLDVRDCANALGILANMPGTGEVAVNVASGMGQPVSAIWRELSELAARDFGGIERVELWGPRAGDPSAQVGGVHRLQALGFAARRSLEESLRDLYAWAKSAVLEAETGGCRHV